MSNNITEKLDNIDKRLSILEKKIDDLIKNTTDNNQTCQKMSNHIDFVENVYSSVKRPFHFLMNIVNRRLITNGSESESEHPLNPLIKNTEDQD